MLRKEFLRFLLVGAVNTGMTLILFEILRRLMPYLIAYGVTYVAGIAISYFLNSTYVFRRRKTARTALLFPLVYVTQYLFGTCALWLLVEHAGQRPTVALLIVIGASIPLTYFLSRTILRVGNSTND